MDYAPCGLQRRGWILTHCLRIALCKGTEVKWMEVDERDRVGLKCVYLSVGIQLEFITMTMISTQRIEIVGP